MAREAWQQRGGVPETPQELNRYAYARNNPLRYTDPTGHHPCVAFLAGGPVGAGVAASCALFFLGVAAIGYFTGEAIRHAVEEGQQLPPPPLSSDTGGQLALPPAPTPDLPPRRSSGPDPYHPPDQGVRGQEQIATFRGNSVYEAFGKARAHAQHMARMGDRAVDFVQDKGPFAGRITGRQSPDGQRGWRLDYDPHHPAKGVHINWWDKTGGAKRADWCYGANILEGATYEDYLALLARFPAP